MKLVINIPKNDYELALQNDYSAIYKGTHIAETIKNGTPLIERPKGNWIDICVIKAFHYDGEPRVRCSRCGNEEEWLSNYCPNCGAEMNGEEK